MLMRLVARLAFQALRYKIYVIYILYASTVSPGRQ